MVNEMKQYQLCVGRLRSSKQECLLCWQKLMKGYPQATTVQAVQEEQM